MRLGVIADTHGYLGSDVVAALAGVDAILHAGDVGDGVLAPLGQIAPVIAVRGNNDQAGEGAALPELAWLDLEGVRLALVHRRADAPPAGWDILVFGHCHRQHADIREGRLEFNPGAAGRRGFHRQRSVALLDLDAAQRAWAYRNLGPRKQAGC